MPSFLMKRFIKLIKINFRRSKPKMSHLSDFPFSLHLNMYQSTTLQLVKTFRINFFINVLKIAMKACNHERMNGSDFKPEVDASLNITCRKVMITYCLSKSYQFIVFD